MLQDFLRYLQLELNRSQLTVKAYGDDLRELAAYLNLDADFTAAPQVSTAQIRAWLADMARNGLSPRSLRRKTQAARAFFRWLQKRQLVAVNPAAEIQLAKIGKKLPEFVREQEMEAMLDSPAYGDDPVIATRNHLVLNLLYSCGIRRDELIRITDADINLYSAELRIHGKRDKIRILPLPPALVDEIRNWQTLRDAQYSLPKPAPLICSRRGAMSGSAIYRIVHDLLLSTGATHKSPHTLRHTFATSLLNDGAEINSVKELLGHSSLQSTQIYTHLSFNEIREAYRAAHPRGGDADPD